MTARVQSQCAPSCARYMSPMNPANTTGMIACAAFPQGIPDTIWDNLLDHRQPIDGDHGLQWTAREGGYEFPVYAFAPEALGRTVVAAGLEDQTVEEHTGAMIALVPADPDMLEIPDGEPADELHCTLVYLGEAADITPEQRAQIVSDVELLLHDHPVVEAEAFGLAAFNPSGEEPCIVLLLSGTELATIRRDVADTIETSAQQHEPWIPHLTLAYTSDTEVISEQVDLCGPITFDRLRVAFGREVTDFPLGAATAPPAEGEPAAEVAAGNHWSDLPGALEAMPVAQQIDRDMRQVHTGCPRCFDPVHDGPCRPGL